MSSLKAGRLHPDWVGRRGGWPRGCNGPIPDPACGDRPVNSPMPPSLVEIMDILEDFRVDRPRLHPLTDILVLSVPDRLRHRQLRGHCHLRPTQLGTAAHLPGPAERDPLARHAGTGFRPAGRGPLQGVFSGPGACGLQIDRGPDRARRRQVPAGLPRPGPGPGTPAPGSAPGPRTTGWRRSGPRWTASPTRSRPSRNCCACRSRGAASRPSTGYLLGGAAGRRLPAKSGSRAPTMCCACEPTRASMRAWRTRGPWNGPGTSPGTPATMRTRSARATGASKPNAAGPWATLPCSPMSSLTGSGATWPAWSGSSLNAAVGTGSRPRSAASFRPAAQGQTAIEAVRKHWSIENAHHWVLDVAFNEDGSCSALATPPTTCCARTGRQGGHRQQAAGRSLEQGLPVPTDRPRPKPIWMQSL